MHSPNYCLMIAVIFFYFFLNFPVEIEANSLQSNFTDGVGKEDYFIFEIKIV